MNKGALIAIFVVIGYFGLEIYAAGKNRYRTEPGFIFGQFAGASRAAQLCGDLPQDQIQRFRNNYAITKRRATRALGEQYPDKPASEIAMLIGEQEVKAFKQVDVLVESSGCRDIEAWKLVKRFKNLARLRLPDTT